MQMLAGIDAVDFHQALTREDSPGPTGLRSALASAQKFCGRNRDPAFNRLPIADANVQSHDEHTLILLYEDRRPGACIGAAARVCHQRSPDAEIDDGTSRIQGKHMVLISIVASLKNLHALIESVDEVLSPNDPKRKEPNDFTRRLGKGQYRPIRRQMAQIRANRVGI